MVIRAHDRYAKFGLKYQIFMLRVYCEFERIQTLNVVS